MKTLKVVFILFIQIVIFSVIKNAAYAYTLSPSSGNFIPNATQQISIIASPPDNSTAVQIRLTISGGVISNYTQPSSSSWLAIGTCTGDTMYTSSSVCVDLAKTTGVITTGESLGIFTVTWGSNTSSTITMSSDNGYLIDEITPVMDYRTGQGGYYVQSGSGVLPTTALESNNLRAITTGIMIMIIGLTGVILILSDVISLKYVKYLTQFADQIKEQSRLRKKYKFHEKISRHENEM